VRRAREEMSRLRERLEDLESSLAAIDTVAEDKGKTPSDPEEKS